MAEINRGSEWRKWDLHVHTPETKLANNFKLNTSEELWDKYCELIEECDVEVFGITDYFTVDTYIKFIEKFKAKFPNSTKIFFPNVEFRLSDKNKDSEHIQFHIIFSNKKETIDKILPFLSRLPLISTDDVKLTSKFCCEKDLLEVTFKKAMVNLDVTIEKLKENFSSNEYVVISLASGYGSLRPGKSDTRGAEYAKEIDKRCKAFFGSSKDTEFYLNIKSGRNAYNLKPKPVFNGSDAHSFQNLIDKLGKNYTKLDDDDNVCDYSEITWIKAEKTFDGLLQVLNEPENRVFIGDFPVVNERVKEFPNKYVDSIEISQIDQYDEKDGVWFKGQKANINPELTVIIGNKGKGKSAITDVIGLCGNSHRQKDFSFLNAKKFKKKDLAKNFKAQLLWYDGNITEKNLNDLIDNNSIEKVKYIPQNFFEELCNNIDDDKAFKKEINDVVFRHIDETERLNKNSFDDFIHEKQTTIYNQIKLIKDKISEININIIDKQIKTGKNNIQNLKSNLVEKETELENLKKNIPIKNYDESLITNLDNNPNFIRTNEISKAISLLKEQEKNNIERLTTINSDILKLNQLEERIKNQELSINEFIIYETLNLKEFNIDPQKVFSQKTKFDTSEINNTILSLKNEKLSMEISLGRVIYEETLHSYLNLDINNFICDSIIKLSTEQTGLLSGFEGNTKAFQEFVIQEKEWKEKQEILVGDETGKNLNTINYFKKEIERCEKDYMIDLVKLKEERISFSIDIYDKKKEIIDIYLSLKNNIEKIIDNNSDKIKEYNINIDATFDINSFMVNFLEYINKNISGKFYGTNESERVIKDLINSTDINNKESFKEFLEDLQSKFEDNGDKNQPPFNQLKQNKEPLDFYDFIFGLDFLKEKYELKLDNKSIEQLSPGERGAALIVFYLLLDNNDIPLIIDQPEDNLDNHSVYKILVPFIKDAKKRRQIIIVTHNPNLAIVSDAELVIHVNIDKENKNTFSFNAGAIENKKINNTIVDILEGTEPAFIKRKDKYGF
ncbi:AAA family ATPase [Flavobacterium pectinovorum]|uniref:TrlF family AAA-like ATPase n=1 Tax=Flavobacterium pectinovorum TaxID=29533 RepID=UPI00265F8385|nr:AAA family ATPase [Flavobacterium pectinovorum]WKL50055.1 AAA family ATPase [Flavobacterium pectinovorum]